jgi:peptidoglycan hydrolase-like protein with peptidoglycan-binding domain
MSNPMVAMAQRFINTVYGSVSGIPDVTEDGQPGWTTMYALTRCLQYELGITALSDNFGPTTLSALTAKYPTIDAATGADRLVRIIQAALYCKNYDGGEADASNLPSGAFSDRVAAAVEKLKSDAGIGGASPGPAVVPKVFKALLTMDAYALAGNGEPAVREIQRWLNETYLARASFFVIPCDGIVSREVQKALLRAIQFELGLSDDAATGAFGPATQDGLRSHTLSVGSAGRWIQLFSAGLVFNRQDGATFTDTFTADLSALVEDFQDFARLPVTGKADYQTWASLLSSSGDKTRRGTAVDCVTEITPARARALRASGYEVVGRYLSNVPGGRLNKMIQAGELDTIAENGLRCFPIYQTNGASAEYFSGDQGASDALSAIDRARFYGFKPGTRIYFAVDFDALDAEVTDRVIPYFRGVKETMDQYGSSYRVGIYGPRNVCSRVGAEGLSTASFVADMSSGYAGNIGFPLPRDWAFDQIATIEIGSGDGLIEIDNNIASGRDRGQDSFDAGERIDSQDSGFDAAMKPYLLMDLQHFLESQGIPERGGNAVDNVAQIYTTTQALDLTLHYDGLITGLARTLRMRKALIAVPVFWGIRKLTVLDGMADEAVRAYHAGNRRNPGTTWQRRDTTTGVAQVSAVAAINARNDAIRQRVITGTVMDPDRDDDVWEIWQKLRGDAHFNISTAAHVLIHAATDIRRESGDPPVRIPKPSLDYSEEHSRLVLRRYQGFGFAAEWDSQIKLGVYRVFEKYFAQARRQPATQEGR